MREERRKKLADIEVVPNVGVEMGVAFGIDFAEDLRSSEGR